MRILFVSDIIYPYIKTGGIESTEHIEMVALSKKHKVSSLSFGSKDIRREFVAGSIHYTTFSRISTKKMFNRNGIRSKYYSVKYALLLPFNMPREKPDVIVANALPYLQVPFLRWYASLHHCILILDVAEVWDKRRWLDYTANSIIGKFGYAFSNYVLKMGDAYISNPGATAESLHRIGIPRFKILPYAPVLDKSVIKSVRAGRRKPRVIYAGRFNDFKRLDKWLALFSKMSKTVKAEGLIIGEGPWKTNLLKRIRSLGLQKRVEVRPFYKDKRNLYKAIKESSVFLNMSEREGLSTVVLESVALGTPVVLPSYTPIPEDVKSMCIVIDEERIPRKMAEIITSSDKSVFLRDSVGLERFYSSGINEFFEMLLERLKRK